ncbi:FAD/NAD(P)-binding domain-containing protein [Dichomitus squalens LYAD-421 SS1]|uniref:FAD/NAD(P)-binding domain-containing protein n=1 Tax=Dichomitus squalens (strain LYAD-421) TaxID=732165 RepID=R7T135_DICSQ|nr:FAD/NAD(P)-binding domain-containing protein [Dichomitus squalens LYAD-421 SS1]EJF62066.1 FAD/NAD(P)-binding domain-containing protein [Dichomitus squalens LYAD-421 SS1]
MTSQDLRYLSPKQWVIAAFNFFYVLVQYVIIWLFKPPPPPSPEYPKHPKGRIAIIGAGLTGVSSAAHAIAHGFDVVIYEQSDKVGGIWTNVNKTSGLQLNSLLYRFHPAVLWSRAFPHRDEILSEIRRIWKEYQLEPRTRFNTPVTSVKRVPGTGTRLSDPSSDDEGRSRWLINDGADGEFDAVVVTVGTCGKPNRIGFPGLPKAETQDGDGAEEKHKGGDGGEVFEGDVFHSSELDDAPLEGRTVVVIGSGASGVEAVETALAKGAKHCVMLAREDKWIIPRNIFVDTLISAQPFGRETPLSFIWEKIIVLLNYRGAPELVPARLGIFESTPVVNDEFVGWVREGKCDYVRGDIERLTKRGVRIKVRGREEKPGEGKEVKEVEGDVVVLATGFHKPQIGFLEEELFPDDYDRPNLYLQNFSTEDWSVLMTNSSYQNAIGTVGHFHIGIYMRILLTFLMDPDARPTPKDMKLWVDVIRFVKRGARGGALSFFTYMELTIWLLLFHVLRIDRLRWVFFIMQGWGVYPEEYSQAKISQKAKAA